MKTSTWAVAAVCAGLLGTGGYLAVEAFAGGSMAPNAPYTLLDGRASSVAQLRGKVVLVNFWATSCTTCMHEMPALAATHAKYKARGFETLGVAMSYDPPAYVIRYAESRKLPFDIAIDNTGAVARSFGDVQLTPTSVLIDKHGRIVKRYVGEPDFAALHGLLEKLLADG